jgi:hypothetical protein
MEGGWGWRGEGEGEGERGGGKGWRGGRMGREMVRGGISESFLMGMLG